MPELTPEPGETDASAGFHSPPPLPQGSDPGSRIGHLAQPQQLDRRVVSLWRIHGFIQAAVMLFVAFVAGTFGSLSQPDLTPYLTAVWLALLVGLVLWTCWFPKRSYRSWSFRLDDRVLEIRHGIWFHTLTLLPLNRLQHVDLEQGPIERFFGLSSLTFYTAGSGFNAIPLPGLERALAVQLRDHLVEVGGDDAV